MARDHGFRGETFAKIFDQHLNSAPPNLTQFCGDIPSSLENLVSRLLEKERHLRPFNARAVQGILSELKYRWEEDESRYQEELSRRQKAFDAKPKTVPAQEVSWQKFGWIIGTTIVIALIAAYLMNR